MNRYAFTKKSVSAAKAHLRDKTKPAPTFVKKYDAELRGPNLFLGGKRVIAKEKVDKHLRKIIYAGKTPLTRDAAYAWVARTVVGISRATIDKFLNKQTAIRGTDAQQATTKNRAKRQVKTKGQLHLDLVEVKFKDLDQGEDVKTTQTGDIPGLPKATTVKKGYFVGLVDALTGLSYFYFVERKTHTWVTPVVKAAIKWFAKELGVKPGKMTIYSDAGSEFQWKLYETKFGVGKTVIVNRDPYIESRNSFFQRALYRVSAMEVTDNIYKMGNLAMQQMNRTKTKTTGKIPVDSAHASQAETKELVTKYNRKRGKDSGAKIKRRKLKVGEPVRVQMIPAGKKKMDYKAYKGIMWSRRTYTVTTVRPGNRYIVNRKLRHRDELRPTPAPDMESAQLVRSRQV